MSQDLSRRDVLKVGAAGAAALGGAGLLASARAADRATIAKPSRTVRFAVVNDCHLMTENSAAEGVTACLRHLMAQGDKPQAVLTLGDMVDRGMSTVEQRLATLWGVWDKAYKGECGLPAIHCVGNHDVWGWNKGKSMTRGDEPRWGKKWWQEAMGVDRTYGAYDRGRWRIIVLDSIYAADLEIKPKEGDRNPPKDIGRYIGRLEQAQMDWLENELTSLDKTRPVMVLSHIPILSIAAVEHDARTSSGDWMIPAGVMHIDAQDIVSLFRAHGNVRLCLSGHIHKNDRLEYDGVTYICAGAVSGSWWRGREDRCDEGYSLVDLYDDGSFGYEYVTYGWQAR